ncbi:uncharacterized protein LOC107042018 [Diachasma alloeum]|uniref:uncharacterized protein LOC107042018 n=1 Tax=Diachasma alloeum TaxID=454923 RepID=UPI00073837CE|nr:uncharacterized protein LOC107042018 [Diachasma alloeum]
MDYRRRPEDRKSSRDYLHHERTPTHRSTTESPIPQNTPEIIPRPKSRYSNRRSSHHSRKSFQNDSDSEEDNNEAAIPEYIGGGSTDPERTDENPADRSNLTGKIEESHETPPKQIKRRKSKRRIHSEEKGVSKAGEGHEENPDEDRDPLKSKRASRTQTDSSASAGSKRKKKRKARGKDDSTNARDELPITEILRKSQENARLQYEESAPLPQLTTDTVYVQGRNGFSAVKIPGDRIARGRRDPDAGGAITHPIKVAILAQKAWRNAGLIYQGLLAGMALMHFLFMQTFSGLFRESFIDYSMMGEIYTNLFSFLVAMSMVSAFDKFDLARLEWDHFREIYMYHCKSFLAIPLYITVFCLHQVTLKFDDKLTLLHYQESNETGMVDGNSTVTITSGELNTWKTITVTKNGLAVLAWLFIALGPQKDMLLVHLQALQKYAYN